MEPVIDRLVINTIFQANCFIVRRDAESRHAVVVDPGGDPAPLLEQLESIGVAVAGILVTHTDSDHIEGVAQLAQSTGAAVWIPAQEADALREGRARNGPPVRPYRPEHEVSDGDKLTLAGLVFDVVGVPGHSPGHVAFAVEGHLFTGDLLFAGSVGRVDFAGGDWPTLIDSIRRLIDRYGHDAVVHAGHGGDTTLGRELRTNPFLQELRAAQ